MERDLSDYKTFPLESSHPAVLLPHKPEPRNSLLPFIWETDGKFAVNLRGLIIIEARATTVNGQSKDRARHHSV